MHGNHMIRTQVYLPKQVHQDVKFVAKREKKSEAQVIRELLAQSLEHKQRATIGHGLASLAELGERLGVEGPPDLSRNIDTYLYED